ncbi:neutral amino acid (glutamate) transporter [Candidatus Protochlamydia naegleriophila]|uniref:Neutral amino acid (Glutamate) transporter n=1 Tax=Candidatus Protochlamydia naegleriophila TaxID=389348 RepID=A0A0U5J9P5_9BACT|nr:dicarboxylate/amino acid:cation symporter [Candidatus Protochlamydia naegleriophila]CUI16520.1 neutral amino acid (glutamate) transporter [Candidatus Protochlamydia naegleriophila]
MCTEVKHKINPNLFFALATICGVCSGYLQEPFIFSAAETISQLFINLLKLVSLPIIFLSIVSTASGMENMQQIKLLGKKVVKYTLLTTIIAASIALALFLAIDPVRGQIVADQTVALNGTQPSYLSFFIQIVPSNIIQPFSENNVIGVLFLAMLLSFAIVTLPVQHRTVLHSFFSSIYAAIITITRWIVAVMPIAIWAFITLFMRDLSQGLDVKSLALYLTVVLAANVIQAGVVLPTLLKIKGISPIRMARGMFPALSVAFFTKSSAAALPMAMRCAEENVGISRKVASFTLPLCTTINMNACAAFILTTVLFVSMSQGVTYSLAEMGLWVILATIAAIGNAGVPMGCYFLASAFLAAMNVPLNILGVILPFYTLIDMLESAINVWSDSCVAAVVNKEVQQEDSSLLESNTNLHLGAMNSVS